MRRTALSTVLAAVLVGGLLVAVTVGALVLRTGEKAPGDQDSTVSIAQDQREADEDDSRSHGLGPPPWAHAEGHDKSHDKAWKQAWQKLTPAQREQKMATLAKEHAQGMRRWAKCVADAGDSPAKRAACEKPLPPGLAKKRP